MNKRRARLMIGCFFGIAVTNACSSAAHYEETCGNPKNEYYWSEECKTARRLTGLEGYGLDAGSPPDASSDAATDPDAKSFRANHCTNNPPNNFGKPQPVWFGTVADAPEGCDPTVGAIGDRAYFGLLQPTHNECAKCSCGDIKGSCSHQMTTIHMRGDTCDVLQTTTTDFGPPENWDGKCSNDHAIAANAECPAQSGKPCVKAAYMSALPDPDEHCDPISFPVLKGVADSPRWAQMALSCSPSYWKPSSEDNANTCYGFPAEKGWRSCVLHQDKGVQECNSNSKYTDRVITYHQDAIVDNRICTECTCEASGGACYGAIRFYEDENCQTLLAKQPMSSDKSECQNLYPPGSAVGSKDMTELLYVSGSCTPKGGVMNGTIELDDSKADTWCCLPKEPEDELE